MGDRKSLRSKVLNVNSPYSVLMKSIFVTGLAIGAEEPATTEGN